MARLVIGKPHPSKIMIENLSDLYYPTVGDVLKLKFNPSIKIRSSDLSKYESLMINFNVVSHRGLFASTLNFTVPNLTTNMHVINMPPLTQTQVMTLSASDNVCCIVSADLKTNDGLILPVSSEAIIPFPPKKLVTV